MSITLYHSMGSPPSRLVLLVAAALNLHLDLVHLDLMKQEQLNPDFVKLNPQHTVPTLNDDGFILWEARAIARYLVYKFGENSTLYPTDIQTRANVDQLMEFDAGKLYYTFSRYFFPQLFQKARPDDDQLDTVKAYLKILDKVLENSEYAVGSSLTLADLSLVSTVSTIDVAGISLEPYPNVLRWYNLVKSTAPGYDSANQPGLDVFQELINRTATLHQAYLSGW